MVNRDNEEKGTEGRTAFGSLGMDSLNLSELQISSGPIKRFGDGKTDLILTVLRGEEDGGFSPRLETSPVVAAAGLTLRTSRRSSPE